MLSIVLKRAVVSVHTPKSVTYVRFPSTELLMRGARTNKHANIGDDKERSAAKLIHQQCARHSRYQVPDLESSIDCGFCTGVLDADTLKDQVDIIRNETVSTGVGCM